MANRSDSPASKPVTMKSLIPTVIGIALVGAAFTYGGISVIGSRTLTTRSSINRSMADGADRRLIYGTPAVVSGVGCLIIAGALFVFAGIVWVHHAHRIDVASQPWTRWIVVFGILGLCLMCMPTACRSTEGPPAKAVQRNASPALYSQHGIGH